MYGKNSVDPDQMPYSAASDLGLHCLQRPNCPNTYGYYGNMHNGMPIKTDEYLA